MTDVSDLADSIEGLLHAETQVTDRGVDLSLAAVYDHEGPGRVDFGGGELEDAERSPREPTLRDPDDDYGWWHLERGTYLVEHNESLTGERPRRLQTRRALRQRGAFHPTVEVTTLGPLPLVVGAGGIKLKENARISTLLPPAE